MKLEWKVTLGAAVFLLLIFVIYWLTSYEAAGSAMLLFGGVAYTMLFGFILLQWRRRRGIPRAEDREDAKHEEAVGEVAYFPAASIWPVGMGLGFVFTFVGLVYGTWYFVIGAILLLGAIIGFNVEAESK